MAVVPIVISMIAFILIVLTAIITFYKHCFSFWKRKGVNYLEPTIPFGNASSFFLGKRCYGELFHDWYLDMKRRGWSIGGAYFCGKPVYVPVDCELIKKIIISDFLTFPNHGMYVNESLDPFSGHIFNMEDYNWKNLRAKLPAAFTSSKMKRYVVIMEKISRKLNERLDEQLLQNKSIEVKGILSRFTIDIITACAFGMESNTLDNENEELVYHSRPFFDHQWSRTSNTLVVLVPRHILSLFRFKLFPTSTTTYFLNMFGKIKTHRQRENVKRNDLTDVLIDLCDETKDHPDFNGKGKMDPLTFNEFATQMYVFFEAGFETSSSTQTFAMYELAANMEVQDRLRNEIETVLKKYNGQVGYDSISEMHYLDRVIDETLRKYPIFPILPRTNTKEYQIPGTDIIMEKDSFVMVTNLGLHYDPEYYPDPMKFDPDRFTPENKAKRPYCSYMPFGEGPRICVGKRFGIWQTKIGIVSIVKNYKITLSKKMQLPFSFVKHGLILKTKGDVWVDLEKIN